jgi:hypothetical protein
LEQPAAVNPRWRTSSYSNNGGGTCVEVGAIPWRKSTYSNNGGGDCVEAGHIPGAVLIRDTKNNGTGPTLRVTSAAWQRFAARVRANAAIS